MAKGHEDTAYYRLPGGPRPSRGRQRSVRSGAERSRPVPRRTPRAAPTSGRPGLTATTTHDTKRSEDVRARLRRARANAPTNSRRASTRWIERRSIRPPTIRARELRFVAQTLLGTWPLDAAELDDLGARLVGLPGEGAARSQGGVVLARTRRGARSRPSSISRRGRSPTAARVLHDAFGELVDDVAWYGAINGLAQLTWKLGASGTRRHLPRVRALGLQPRRPRQPPAGRLRAAHRVRSDDRERRLALGRRQDAHDRGRLARASRAPGALHSGSVRPDRGRRTTPRSRSHARGRRCVGHRVRAAPGDSARSLVAIGRSVGACGATAALDAPRRRAGTVARRLHRRGVRRARRQVARRRRAHAAPGRAAALSLISSSTVGGRVQRRDVELLHAEHRLHRPLPAPGVGVVQHLLPAGRARPATTSRTCPSASRTGSLRHRLR